MCMNQFIKSSKTTRLNSLRSATHAFERMTQFYARGKPFDIRTAEREFRLHNPKQTDLTQTLEALQQHRTEINRILSFFQQIRFVDNGDAYILKAIDSRSEFVLEIDTNKFIQFLHTPPPTNYFFWSMVVLPFLIAVLLSPDSAADSVRSAEHDRTTASSSNGFPPG
jgi:hypothetical protein